MSFRRMSDDIRYQNEEENGCLEETNADKSECRRERERERERDRDRDRERETERDKEREGERQRERKHEAQFPTGRHPSH